MTGDFIKKSFITVLCYFLALPTAFISPAMAYNPYSNMGGGRDFIPGGLMADNSGNVTNLTGFGSGNSGQGVGNTGPGNQGNDKDVGNAGGDRGQGGDNQGSGNQGGGFGNTGTGNQGNDKDVGNAGGDKGTGGGNTQVPSNPPNDGQGNKGQGNEGQGVGGSGSGNQGNDKDVGNAGGDRGQGGGQGNQGQGNEGQGVGGSGSGNQGNDKDVGNAGGDKGQGGGGDNSHGGGGEEVVPPENTITDTPKEDEKESEEHKKQAERKANVFGYKISPVATVDADGYTYVINLTTNAEVGAISPDQIPKSNAGFKVVKMRTGSLGLGVDASMFVTGVPVDSSVGLMVTGGRTYISENYVKSYEEVSKIPFITMVPSKPERFNKMAIGDSLTYVTTGTISFLAGVSVYAVGAGAEGSFTGTWLTNVRKVSPTRVQVAYTKGKVGKIKLGARVLVGEAAKNWYKGFDENLAFEFDLAKKNGWDLYRRMLWGDVKNVKRFYLKEMVSRQWAKYAQAKRIPYRRSVVKLAAGKWLNKATGRRGFLTPQQRRDAEIFFNQLTAKMITVGTRQTEGTAATVSVGLPILFNYVYTPRSKDLILEKTQELADGLIGKGYYGVYQQKSSTGGVASKHSHRLKLFMGGVQEITILNPGDLPKTFVRMFGQFKYSFGQTGWREDRWDHEIMNLSRRIGFREELSKIRKPYDKRAEFGHISADYVISQKSFVGLMKWANSNRPEPMIKAALTVVENWFENKENERRELCDGLVRQLCKKEILKDTEKGIKLAYESLMKMNAAWPSGNEKSSVLQKKLKTFAREMANFGEGFSQTQFTVQAFIKLVNQGDGDQYMVAQWQGNPIKRDALVLIPSRKMVYFGNQPCGEIGDRDCLRQRALNREDPM